MSDDASRMLARLANGGPDTTMRCMFVDAVRSDGRINLRDGEAIVTGVPCLPSYTARAADDQVIVLQGRLGLVVIGKMGGEAAAPGAAVEVSWGTGAPSGSGWVTGTPYVRDGEVYIATGGGGGSSTPKAVTVAPTARAVWRDGRRESDRPVAQGAWPSYPHPFTSGWFFDNDITAAVAGKTVSSMQMRLGRSSSSHGRFGQVRPRLYLVSAGTPGSSPPALGETRTGPGLGLGGSATWTLPSSWGSALVAGTARGIVVSAGVGNDYLVFDSASGGVTIRFS